MAPDEEFIALQNPSVALRLLLLVKRPIGMDSVLYKNISLVWNICFVALVRCRDNWLGFALNEWMIGTMDSINHHHHSLLSSHVLLLDMANAAFKMRETCVIIDQNNLELDCHQDHPEKNKESGGGRREELRPWSQEERDILRALHTQRLSNADIAQQLGRTSEAVSNMSRRLGLRRRETARPWTSGQLRILQQMLDDGCSLKEIADTTGHPRSSVADKLRRLNVQSSRFRRPWTDEERDQVVALHAAGASLAVIAEAVPSRSLDAVQQKLQELVGPAPFRSAQRSLMVPGVGGQGEPTPAEPETVAPMPTLRVASVLALVPSPAAALVASPSPLPSPPRTSVRLIRERREVKPAFVMASVDEMVRWLRSRDFMVLYRTPGWQVDRHILEDEGSLLDFVNVRRRRLNLAPFVTSGSAGRCQADDAMVAVG